MLDLRYVLSLLRAEKHLSAVDEDTGIVSKICTSLLTSLNILLQAGSAFIISVIVLNIVTFRTLMAC